MSATGDALALWAAKDSEETTVEGVPIRFRRVMVEDVLAQVPDQHRAALLEYFNLEETPEPGELESRYILALMHFRENALRMGLVDPRIAGPGEAVNLSGDPAVVTVGMLGSIGEAMTHKIVGMEE
jgi:hypothetical protein